MTEFDNIQHLIDAAKESYRSAVVSARTAFAGGPMTRTDGTSYTIEDPLSAIERYTEDLAAAAGAYELALNIERYAGKTVTEDDHRRGYFYGVQLPAAGEIVDLALAARIALASHQQLRDGVRHGDLIRAGIADAKRRGADKLAERVEDAMERIEEKREARAAKEAAKFEELIGGGTPDVPGLEEGSVAENLFDQLREAAVTVLTNPRLRAQLTAAELAELQHPFGFSPEYVAGEVEREERNAAEKRAAEARERQAARSERDAKRCKAKLGGYGRLRCEKTGRYEVTLTEFERGSGPGVARFCGTHVKSELCYYGASGSSVVEYLARHARPGVAKVVDTKTGETIFEKVVVAN